MVSSTVTAETPRELVKWLSVRPGEVNYASSGDGSTGLLAGELYPAMPLFGVTPCPLLIFTVGLRVWASCARWWLWIVPLLWSAIGGSAAILLSVPQDWALPVSAIAAMLVLVLDRQSATSATA